MAEWWGIFSNYVQYIGFFLTAFGAWASVAQTHWPLWMALLCGFLINVTNGLNLPDGVPPTVTPISNPPARAPVYWVGYVVFLFGVVFGLGERVVVNQLPISVAAQVGGLIVAVSIVVVGFRYWFELRRKRRT